MKLYATITKANGKSEGLGDNEDLVVNFYHKNKVIYMVRLSYSNVGDLEKPAMDVLITSRDYRAEKPEAKKQQGEEDGVCRKCGEGPVDSYEGICYDCQMKS